MRPTNRSIFDIAALPDKFGVYRNCITKLPSGIYFPQYSSGTLKIVRIQTILDVPATAYSPLIGTKVSNLVPFELGVAFLAHATSRLLYRTNSTAIQTPIPTSAANYLTSNGSTLYYRDINPIGDPVLPDPVNVTYVRCCSPYEEFTSFIRTSENIDYEDKFISTPIRIVRDFVFVGGADSFHFTNFAGIEGDSAGRMVYAAYEPGAEKGWVFATPNNQLASSIYSTPSFIRTLIDLTDGDQSSDPSTVAAFGLFYFRDEIIRVSQGSQFGQVIVNSSTVVSFCGTQYSWVEFSRVEPVVLAERAYFFAPQGGSGRAVFRFDAGGLATVWNTTVSGQIGYGIAEALAVSNNSLVVIRGSDSTRLSVNIRGGEAYEQSILPLATVLGCPEDTIIGMVARSDDTRPDVTALYLTNSTLSTNLFLINSETSGFASGLSGPIFMPRYPIAPALYNNLLFAGVAPSSGFLAYSNQSATPYQFSAIPAANFTGFPQGTEPTMFAAVGGDIFFSLSGSVRDLVCAHSTVSHLFHQQNVKKFTGIETTDFGYVSSDLRSVQVGQRVYLPLARPEMLLLAPAQSEEVFALQGSCNWNTQSDIFGGDSHCFYTCYDNSTDLLRLFALKTSSQSYALRNFSAESTTLRFLDKFNGFVYFYTDSHGASRERNISVWKISDTTRTTFLAWSTTIPAANGTTPILRMDSVVVNNRDFLIRLSTGQLLLADAITPPTPIYFFPIAEPPVPSRSKKLIFATNFNRTRLFFPAYSAAGTPTLYSSEMACFVDQSCNPGMVCNQDTNFCETPVPVAPPVLPPVAPPLAPPLAPPPVQPSCPAAVCFPEVIIPSGGTLLVNSSVTVFGNFSVTSPNTTIFVKVGASPAAPLQVGGCVVLDGQLVIVVDPNIQLQQGARQVIAFEEYCNGNQTRFSSVSVDSGCRKADATPTYGAKSFSIVFSSIDLSGCPQAPVEGGFVFTVPIIVGIAVAAGIIFLAIVITIILVCCCSKKVQPYSNNRRSADDDL